MSMTIDPPDFSSQNFELYKQELRAWSEVTEVSRSKQAIVIALSIKDTATRENVLSQLSLEDLKQDNGLEILINFLDSFFEKHEISDALEKYEDFEKFQRSDNQSIRDFIACFDMKYRKLEKLKINLPQEILAFKMLGKANISREMRLMVLSGINFADKDTMYEQATGSLRKFAGDIHVLVHCDKGELDLKLMPKCKAAYKNDFAAGVCEQRKSNDRETNGLLSKTGLRKRINPVGIDGNRLLCKSCGSYRHLLNDCPHSWENINRNKQYNVVNQKDREMMSQRVDSEILSLKREIMSLKEKIMKMGAVKEREQISQKEEIVGLQNNIAQEKTRVTVPTLNQRISVLQEERNTLIKEISLLKLQCENLTVNNATLIGMLLSKLKGDAVKNSGKSNRLHNMKEVQHGLQRQAQSEMENLLLPQSENNLETWVSGSATKTEKAIKQIFDILLKSSNWN